MKTFQTIGIILIIACVVIPTSAYDSIFPFIENFIVPVLGVYYFYRFIKWLFTDHNTVNINS